jgi:hypothetical protein
VDEDMPKPTREVIGEVGIPAEDVRDIGLGSLEELGRLLTDRELREGFWANTEQVKRGLSWEERLDEQEGISEFARCCLSIRPDRAKILSVTGSYQCNVWQW